MMTRAVILACVLPFVALADIWPSWLSPMQGGYDRGNQCLSGAVERLTVAAGADAWKSYATTNIFEDYFKQRTKAVACKNMVKACYTNYIDRSGYAEYAATHTPSEWLCQIALADPETKIEAMMYTSTVDLLNDCGLATNYLDVTSAFNLSDTNGWGGITNILGHLVWTRTPVDWHPNDWRPELKFPDQPLSGVGAYSTLSFPLYMDQYLSLGAGSYTYFLLLSIYPSYVWAGQDYIGHDKVLPPTHYFPNAQGSWTTSSGVTSWGTNYLDVLRGVDLSFSYSTATWPGAPEPSAEECGMSWDYVMEPYMVKARPKAVLGYVCVSNATVAVVPTDTNDVVSVVTNVVMVYGPEYTVVTNYTYPTHWENITSVSTNAFPQYETNGLKTITNSVPYTNSVVSTNLVKSYTSLSTATNVYCFGTTFVGTRTNLLVYTSMIREDWITTTNNVVTNNNETAEVDNVLRLTNDLIVVETNTVETKIEDEPIFDNVQTNYIQVESNQVSTVTNQVIDYVTNITSRLRYAAGKTTINGVPYIGNDTMPAPTFNKGPFSSPYGMTPLCTNYSREIDLCYRVRVPTNFVSNITASRPNNGYGNLEPWHGHEQDALDTATNLSEDGALHYDDVDDMPVTLIVDNAWYGETISDTTNKLIFGTPFAFGYERAKMEWDYAGIYFDVLTPTPDSAYWRGWEIYEELAVMRWNVTNGFQWFK